MGRSNLPAGLADQPPGARLGSMLESIDRRRLNGYELAVYVAAWERQKAHTEAQTVAATAELAHAAAGGPSDPATRLSEPHEFAADELAITLGLTRRSAEHRMSFALDLTSRLPNVWRALNSGSIDYPRAKVLADDTRHLPDALARHICNTQLEVAGELTTGQLRARVRRHSVAVAPEHAADRYRQGVQARRLTRYEADDGTATLVASQLPADAATAAMDHVERLARAVKTEADPRTMDQIRTDVYLDLLRGQAPATRAAAAARGVVDVVVDLETLMQLNDKPGEIPGWGPVIADIARQVAAENLDGEWRVTLTDGAAGSVLWNGTTRRRPTTKQRRAMEARFRSCVWPGCRQPARKADFDHTVAWSDGGATSVANAGPLCRHHHRVKHTSGWHLERAAPNSYLWTTPHAHQHESISGRAPP